MQADNSTHIHVTPISNRAALPKQHPFHIKRNLTKRKYFIRGIDRRLIYEPMAVAMHKLHDESHPKKHHRRFQDSENINLFSELTDVPEDMLKELNNKRHDPTLCDVSITTNDGGRFHAHKRVLSSCSRYLKRKLSFADSEDGDKRGETVIHLGMVSSKSCEILLELLYTSKLFLTKENAAEVLLAAQVLDLPSVSSLCRQFLRCDVVSKIVTKEVKETVLFSSGEKEKYPSEKPSLEEHDSDVFEDPTDGDAATLPSGDSIKGLHQLDNGEGLGFGDNYPKGTSPKQTTRKPSSLSNVPSQYNGNQCAHRPLSAPGPSTTCAYKVNAASERATVHNYEMPSPLDLSKTDVNIATNTQVSRDEVFSTQPQSSIRLKLKSEMQYLPESNKNYDIATASVGYIDPGYHFANPSYEVDPSLSPLLHRRSFAEAFLPNRAVKENRDGIKRSKVARLEQLPIPGKTHLPEYINPAGFHPQAPALWAYMMQSQALSQTCWYGNDNDSISKSYERYLFNDIHRSTSTASPHMITCQLCGTECTSDWQFLMHLRLSHCVGYITPPNIITPPFRSELLGESNYERTDLNRVPPTQTNITLAKPQQHEVIMNNYEDERVKTALLLMRNAVPSKARHKCYHCKKDFDSIFLLRKHKSIEHVKRPHRCHVCQAAFPNKAGLSVHIRSHTGERPYLCKVCNKAFTQLGHVQRHQKVHTGEKPYQCPLCHARVRDKASMHYHLLAHQGVKPFHCDQCDARFTKRSSLVKHKNVHTGSYLYQCPQCQASFREKASLSRHVRSQHKESFLPSKIETPSII